jgi:MFS-type transporter involved in bile tolerance (Atg22 family)
MSAGSALVATSISVATTIGGAVLMGFVLAPLSTHYSLELDKLAPPSKRAEIFALLRTANAMGVIFASAMMTMSSITTALVATTGLMICATLLVAVASRRKLGTLRP